MLPPSSAMRCSHSARTLRREIIRQTMSPIICPRRRGLRLSQYWSASMVCGDRTEEHRSARGHCSARISTCEFDNSGRDCFSMKICKTVEDIRAESRNFRQQGKRIGLVPTMGALHEGHLSLVREAKARCDAVIVSIFVNPTQFGPNEDFSKYPRTFERDCAMLEREKVDFGFAPSVEEMYPPGAVTFVNVESLSEKLCGRSRPGHFRGVTTVLAKLFHAVEPDVAFFGQKDAAQVAIIRRMVRDLSMSVQIVVCPIVREP